MDIYLLDSVTYERVRLLDEVQSFIWTERMSSHGDFEIVLAPSRRWSNFYLGRYISHAKSNTLMIIEEKLESTDAQGETLLTIRGRSIDTILERRVVVPPEGKNVWTYTGTIGDALYRIVRESFIIPNTLSDSLDVIPELYFVNGVTDTEVLEFAVGLKSVYSAVKEIADTKDLTFGITFRDHSPRFSCHVREGVERDVVFSSLLDTLSETSHLETQVDYFNTAYVWSKDGLERTVVGIPNIYLEGVNRRVLAVDAGDLQVDENTPRTKLYQQMRQRGLEALRQQTQKNSFDGKVTNPNIYRYGIDYRLGDIVSLIDSDNISHKVRVSEYIFAYDSEGFRDYPTFTSIGEN